ncbi:response regulator [Maricaulaceae bacterium MS644]
MKILLVDDDPTEFIFLEDALDADGGGHELSYAESGRAALRQLREVTPDVIILDLRMPGMTGFDVLEAVRADPSLAGSAVMVLSNSAIAADRTQALALGAQDYRVKPLTPDGYAELVDAMAKLASPASPDSTGRA